MPKKSASNQLKMKTKGPVCLRNETYCSALNTVQDILSGYSNLPLQALLVGSGHRKRTPPDADILVVRNELNSEIAPLTTPEIMNYLKQNIINFKKLSDNNFLRHSPLSFYHSLPKESFLRVLADLCCAGASIKEVYQKNKRSIIKIGMGEAILELNLEYSSFEAHAAVSDFTINTLYYDIKTASYAFAHEYAFNDIQQKILRATHEDIHSMFEKDITVFFRALRIIGSEEYTAEPKLLKVMQDLPNTLPSAISAMNPDRLTLDKYILLCSGYAINVLNFIDDNKLFDYLFFSTSSESNQDKKRKLFLFRKISEASDALFLNKTSHEYYPHDIAQYMESVENLSLDDRKKIMLCFFDYAIHHAELLEKNIDPNKYTIYHHGNSMGFYAMQRHIDSITAIGKKLISHYLASYQDTYEETQAIENTNDNSSRVSLNNESQGTHTDEETIEEYLSESDNGTSRKTESLSENSISPEESDSEDLTSANSNELAPNPSNNDIQEASEQLGNVLNEEKSKKSIKNKKKNAKRLDKKKKSQEQGFTGTALPSDADDNLSSYNFGLQNLEIMEYAFALDLLTRSSANLNCQNELMTKAMEAVRKIDFKNTAFSEKVSLQAAILFDSAGEKNNAICYYRNFLSLHAEENVVGNRRDNQMLGDLSFVYLRLLMLSHFLSQENLQPPIILEHEKKTLSKIKSHTENIAKYYKEIILNPTISAAIISQARIYVESENIPFDTNVNPLHPSSFDIQSIRGGENYLLGAYYLAMLNYEKSIEYFVEPEPGIKSGIKANLLISLFYCYMQLNLHEKSVDCLEKINQEDKGVFINDEENSVIIDNIFAAISTNACSVKLEDYCQAMVLLERILYLAGKYDYIIQFFKEALDVLPSSCADEFSRENISCRTAFVHFKISDSCCAYAQILIKMNVNQNLAQELLKEAAFYHTKYLNHGATASIAPEKSQQLSKRITIASQLLGKMVLNNYPAIFATMPSKQPSSPAPKAHY